MHIVRYVLQSMAPALLFIIVSIPTKRRSLFQELILLSLWLAGLITPIYYAGQFSYISSISVSVWCWATGLKMAVWLFCMSMDERRKRLFLWTLFHWRTRSGPLSIVAKPDEYVDLPLMPYVWDCVRHQCYFELMVMSFRWLDAQRPIHIFQHALGIVLSAFYYPGGGDWLHQNPTITIDAVLVSFGMCILFSIYLQMQMQVTYDAFMAGCCAAYRAFPYLEQQYPQHQRRIRQVKAYIEDTVTMPPMFDAPWSATSLRDFWSHRWHKFYHDSFYRLGFVPVRRTLDWIGGPHVPRSLRRILPALAVFCFSGIMHEYFLYCAAGPKLYFGSPLGAGGWQLIFFVVQIFGIIIGDLFFHEGWAGSLWAIAYMVFTSHLFVVPYLLLDNFSFAIVSMTLKAFLQ
ncbi:membrane bound O-acyl transferase family-domain-containing protein [Radiomyces spectabilis]|uniref:membrane bound O-acyl transferase family-domain-containing protein n=1 Tax=Radiomyces spectabilis TaxID=64574 RepID=UPI0022210550|nr:membrane bound O-acyl transferase family-domain-containing protein [Radiomyces spectabilis]KAI8366797.1 membrane bound O-acyl transferase family-domain-containing protein [Radiomyces spectabilis]